MGNSIMTMAERVELGAVTTVIGLVIVLSVLAILWGVLELFRVFFYEIPKKKAAMLKAEKDKVVVAASTPVVVAPVEEKEADETELIAVLTAAIAASLNTSASGLQIKSFRRTDGSAPIWNRVSRKNQLDNTL